jgi:FkbM family methyltransferase
VHGKRTAFSANPSIDCADGGDSLSQTTMIAAFRKLRPAKVRTALRRRWFEQRMSRLPLAPVDGLVRLGSDYGGWVVPESWVDADWTCYCIGAGGDITFDLALARDRRALVRCFDPDEDYIRRAQADAAAEARFTTHQLAIASADGPIRMQRTHIAGSRSLSPADLYDTRDYVEVPGRTVRSLMDELGDSTVELLKLDIEGGEYDLLDDLRLAELGVRVFCTQLHHTASVRRARSLIAGIRAQGYRLVASVPAVKLTFVREAGPTAARPVQECR